jgi:hypothetical protein
MPHTPEQRKAYYEAHRSRFLAEKRNRYKRDRDVLIAERKAYYWANREAINQRRRSPENRAKARDYRRRKPDQHRNSWLKYNYGITLDQFNEMSTNQKHKCAICGRRCRHPHRWKGVSHVLRVDHCHKTNRVRGLLCHRCNAAIGLFGDNTRVVEKALIYLKTR